ncbi:MAG: hypothetical protein RLZZ127_1192 [Planctomycetota bacterium]|jgi:hypothetical protein
MSAPRFLISHGEKIGVAAVAAGVAVWVWSTAADPALKPKDNVDRATVDADFQRIEQALLSPQEPKLKPVPAYLDQLRGLLAQEVPARPRMGWLSVHPDVGPIIKHKPFFYIYELPTVDLTAADRVGSIELSITVPAPARTADRETRVADGTTMEWTRSDGGTVVNRARRVAVQVEVKTGEGAWRPLVGKGVLPGGFVPLSALGKGVLEIPGMEPWAKHQFRARLVAMATAFDPVAHAQTRASVLVHPGPFVAQGQNGLAELKRLMEQWPDTRDGELEGRLLKPFLSATTGLPAETLAAFAPKPLESLFLGPQGAPIEVTVTSDTRFALRSASVTESGATARILVTKQFRLENGKSAWLNAPHQFTTLQGQSLGGVVKGETPVSNGRTVEIPLNTPFVVGNVRRGVERIWYYEVIAKARQGGGKGRDLLIQPKITKTEIVTLQNPQSGAQFDLVGLDAITKAGKAVKDRTGRPIVYPAIFEYDYNEIDVFSKNPAEFTTYGLVPPAPVSHKPDAGPLPALLAKGVLTARTDTDYIEFPDGRLIWWYPLENSVEQWTPEGFQFPKGPATVPITPPADAGAGPAPGPGAGGQTPPTRPGTPAPGAR